MTPSAVCTEDFDDVPAMRREIQRLNDKIDAMHDRHIEQMEAYITDRIEMAKWIAGHQNASDDKTAAAVDRTLGHLSTMGVQERVKMQSRMPLWILRVARELSEREIDDMRTVIKAEVLTSEFSFRSSVLAVELIRRKPGNVSLVSP